MILANHDDTEFTVPAPSLEVYRRIIFKNTLSGYACPPRIIAARRMCVLKQTDSICFNTLPFYHLRYRHRLLIR